MKTPKELADELDALLDERARLLGDSAEVVEKMQNLVNEQTVAGQLDKLLANPIFERPLLPDESFPPHNKQACDALFAYEEKARILENTGRSNQINYTMKQEIASVFGVSFEEMDKHWKCMKSRESEFTVKKENLRRVKGEEE